MKVEIFAIACLLFTVGMAGEGSGAVALTEINASPNPARTVDTITVGSDGVDAVTAPVGYPDQAPTYYRPQTTGTWRCMSFVPSETKTVNTIKTRVASGSGGFVSKMRLFDYVNDDETGALLASQESPSSSSSTYVRWYDFTAVSLEIGARYWVCEYIAHFSAQAGTINDIADGNHLRYNAGEPVEYSAIGGTLDETDIMGVIVSGVDYTDVQLIVKRTTGDYNTTYIAAGDFAQENPSVTFQNPCTTSCILQAKASNGEGGWSEEVQTTLYVEGFTAGAAQKTGIYVVASDWATGSVSGETAADYSTFMHTWQTFATSGSGSTIGKILIDGAVTTTCNYEWDCLQDLAAGSHTYSLYSVLGGYNYSGMFTVDANTNFVKIYVPLTYNIFEVYETSNEEALVDCSDIYSLSSSGNVSLNQRISTGLWIDSGAAFWDANRVIPANCYSDESVPALYSYALPGYYSGIEPLIVVYSGSEGIDDDLLGRYYSNIAEISGVRHKNGEINFYSMHAEDEFYLTSGVWEGRVEQRVASADDGTYSPLIDIVAPNINYNSAIFGDANYNTGDFGFGDNITCEAALLSHGFAVYDVNMLLISDKNAIYAQWAFSPYKKYNNSMDEAQSHGAYNYVWHKFEDVNIGHTGAIHCAFQAKNELGNMSGWVYSAPRAMWGSNAAGAGGIRIDVKDEDGTIATIGRYSSPQNADINYIDIYNFKYEPYFWSYNTSANPLSLLEGDSVIAQTYDGNTKKSAGKVFPVGRGDEFSIDLYLPDMDDSDQQPTIYQTALIDDGLTRFSCRTSFYDKDLDWNGATFKIWTMVEGDYQNPVCEFSQTYATTTNCSSSETPCNTPAATSALHNECGSDNDCYVLHSFGKRDCTTATAGGRLTLYCAVDIEDMNGNITTAQATRTIDVQPYYIYAFCESYADVGGERQPVIYTQEDNAYVECIVGVDNMLTPDSNFTVELLSEYALSYVSTDIDLYGQKTFIYRGEFAVPIKEYATSHSADAETWEGDMSILVTHAIYGSYDTVVHVAVTFVGSRVEADIGDGGDYTRADFDQLYDFVEGLGLGMLTDPVGTIQANFFTFLIIVFAIIVFVPLALAGAAIRAKLKQEGD